MPWRRSSAEFYAAAEMILAQAVGNKEHVSNILFLEIYSRWPRGSGRHIPRNPRGSNPDDCMILYVPFVSFSLSNFFEVALESGNMVLVVRIPLAVKLLFGTIVLQFQAKLLAYLSDMFGG